MVLKSVLKFSFLYISVGFLIKIFFLAYASERIFEYSNNYFLLIGFFLHMKVKPKILHVNVIKKLTPEYLRFLVMTSLKILRVGPN